MWIIECIELGASETHPHRFLVGPFGTDDQAEDTAEKLQTAGHVLADVQPLVEPVRAVAGGSHGFLVAPTARRGDGCVMPRRAVCCAGLPGGYGPVGGEDVLVVCEGGVGCASGAYRRWGGCGADEQVCVAGVGP